MDRRKLIIIGATVGGILIVGIAAYFLLFAPKNSGLTVGEPTDPFGSAGPSSGGGPLPEIGVPQGGAGEIVAPRLVKITEGPVAYGSVAFVANETAQVGSTTQVIGTDTEIRYVERTTGNIYAYRVGERTLTRLTNRTLPGVEEAVWAPDGSRVFVRFMTDESTLIETYSFPVANESAGYFLQTNLDAVVVNQSGQVLTLLSGETGSTGTLANADGGNAKTLFTTLLASLRIFPSGTSYAAHTKASAHIDGYGFLLSGATFERIAGPHRGLSVLPSPSGKSVLYTYVVNGTLKAELIDTATRSVISLPVTTFSEKCAWAKDETKIFCAVPRALSGTLPDDWYQGAVSFSDRFWSIDLSERVASLIFDPSTAAKADIDAASLATDQNGDVVIFTNRKDGSLWVYDL